MRPQLRWNVLDPSDERSPLIVPREDLHAWQAWTAELGEECERLRTQVLALENDGMELAAKLGEAELRLTDEPDDYVPHGLDGCTCDAYSEDPHCPHHGYEAVIRRLRRQLERAVSAITQWLRSDEAEALREQYEHEGVAPEDGFAHEIEHRFGRP